VVQLYTQALGSLFVVSYDWQEDGEGFGTHLQAGQQGRTNCLLSFDMTRTAHKTTPPITCCSGRSFFLVVI
jgi:hypothetical protein